VRRYWLSVGVCAVLGIAGYTAEVAYFGDNETISSAWRILATSVVALLLVAALGAAVLGWKRSLR
jgi:hypothetical protein